MKRLYFLVPDVDTATRIVDDLKSVHIKDKHIHILSTDPDKIEKRDLHAVAELEATDAAHMLKQGATAGLLCGLAVVFLPGSGFVVGLAALLEAGLTGAGLGAVIGSLIGLGRHEPVIERYEAEVEGGKLLMLVDIPRRRREEVVDVVEKHFPDVQIDELLLSDSLT